MRPTLSAVARAASGGCSRGGRSSSERQHRAPRRRSRRALKRSSRRPLRPSAQAIARQERRPAPSVETGRQRAAVSLGERLGVATTHETSNRSAAVHGGPDPAAPGRRSLPVARRGAFPSRPFPHREPGAELRGLVDRGGWMMAPTGPDQPVPERQLDRRRQQSGKSAAGGGTLSLRLVHGRAPPAPLNHPSGRNPLLGGVEVPRLGGRRGAECPLDSGTQGPEGVMLWGRTRREAARRRPLGRGRARRTRGSRKSDSRRDPARPTASG